MRSKIKFPVIGIDTSSRPGKCVLFYSYKEYVEFPVNDAIYDLSAVVQQIIQLQVPKSVLWIASGQSYTGLRLGWCVARLFYSIYDCLLWCGTDTLYLALQNPKQYNFIGPKYE
jgi:hypothetical protein